MRWLTQVQCGVKILFWFCKRLVKLRVPRLFHQVAGYLMAR